MKIAQVTPVYPPYRGGIGAVAFEYTEHLKKRGHEVEVFAPGVNLKPLFKIGNAAFVPELRNKLLGFDLVHLHYPFFGGAEFVATWKMMSNTPLVTTYHHDVFGKGLKGLIFKTHGEIVKKMVLGASDKILVNSFDYLENSSIRSVFDQDKDKFVEMPFGVDIERFRPGQSDKVRSKLGIPHDAPTIIFVGGLDRAHYFKGIPILLKALKKISADSWEGEKKTINNSWHAIIVGSGDLQASYQALAKKLGLAERVHFAGNVSVEDLPEYYRAADVHVLPATDSSEAFGVVTVEAAASGLPSIVSDLPGVRSVIKDKETGLVASPGNVQDLKMALKDMLSNKSRCRSYGQAARKRVEEKYDWSVLMDKLEGVYKSLLTDL